MTPDVMEHADLAAAATELRRAVTAPATDRDRWRRDVRAALGAFEDALEAHTESTQSRDGTFAQALEASLGRVRAEIDRLTRDHVRLWSQVRFLHERLDESGGDLTADVDALVSQVDEHAEHVTRFGTRHRQRLE